MHILSLVKIHWCLLNLSSGNGNENMGVSWADYSVKILRHWPISSPQLNLHSINAHTTFGENPLMFTHVIIRKWNTDGRTNDWRGWGWGWGKIIRRSKAHICKWLHRDIFISILVWITVIFRNILQKFLYALNCKLCQSFIIFDGPFTLQ